MKRGILFILVLSLQLLSYSQKFEQIDTTKWLCNYKYEFLQDSTSKYSLIKLQMILQIGSKVSKYEDLRHYLCDSLLFHNNNNELSENNINSVLDQATKLTSGINTNLLASNIVYKNYPAKGTSSFIAYADHKYFKVNQPMQLTWKLENSKDTIIANYNCKKARTSFAGRHYIAFYTLEIPINEGPYKFNGLPGLIVKINDEKNEHRLTLLSFKKLKYGQPITLSKIDYVEISPKEYIMVLNNSINKLFSRIQTGDITIFNEEGKAKSMQGLKAKNNFIEKF